MKGKIGQMDIVTGIFKLLDKHGLKTLHDYQMSAVIDGANTIMAALNRPFKPARPGMGLTAWRECDDTGASSDFMAYKLAGGPPRANNHPHDPNDFGRCHLFLEAVPEAREKLPILAAEGTIWEGLVAAWSELEALYLAEVPTGKAPMLYERMRAIIEAAR